MTIPQIFFMSITMAVAIGAWAFAAGIYLGQSGRAELVRRDRNAIHLERRLRKIGRLIGTSTDEVNRIVEAAAEQMQSAADQKRAE
jgi:hypothetical protein